MKIYSTAVFTCFALSGCAGGGTGPGYLFYIIFLIIPLYWIGYSLMKKTEDNTDSLYVIEGQLKRLIDKADKEKTDNNSENNKKQSKTQKSKTN